METIVPSVADSRSGENAYIFQCDVTGQQRYYAACLRLINDQKNVHLESIYPDCIGAIKKKTCPALKMRKDEIEADCAIYFKEREMLTPTIAPAVISTNLPTSHLPSSEIKKTETSKSKRDNILDRVDNAGYANALNEMIKTKPLRIPEPLPVPDKVDVNPIIPVGVAKPGESLLEMARRMLAAKS